MKYKQTSLAVRKITLTKFNKVKKEGKFIGADCFIVYLLFLFRKYDMIENKGIPLKTMEKQKTYIPKGIGKTNKKDDTKK